MSGDLPELPNSYVSIPIPQREGELPEQPRRDASEFFRKIRLWQRDHSIPISAQNLRRREFLQSVLIAIVINLLIVISLLSVVIDPLQLGDINLFTATISEESKTEEKTDSAAGGASASASGNAGNPGSADISGMNPPSITSIAITPMTLTTASTDLNAPSLMFGQSVVKSDFAAIESQERRKMREFVYGNGSHHAGGHGGGTGVSEGILKGLFPESKHGDGSGMAVIVDMSGSMQEISHAVEDYIARTFPKGVTAHINGCSLKGADNPFLRTLTSLTRKGKRTEYYFICDLQDGETGEGIGRISNCLISGELPKRLHIISFDKPPSAHLAQLLKVTEGTFTYIDPTLDQEEK